MPVELCCPNCFGDRELRDRLFPNFDPVQGTCSYCQSETVPLVPPAELGTYFEAVISLYEPDSTGKNLVQLLKEDWHLFSHLKMDNANASYLLSEILDDGEIVRQKFAHPENTGLATLFEWEVLRDELMYRNRWFFTNSFDLVRLQNLLDALIARGLPKRWYRARLRKNGAAFAIENMGAPGNGQASHGRANPAGIPYLYMASTHNTAVAEVRPNTGDVACVADFAVPPLNMKIVDLRSPRKQVSPFVWQDISEVKQLLFDLPFLERLGEELSRPVHPESAAIDYIPSQFLCEFAKSCGFQGVVYRSSVAEGFNLALFNPELAIGGLVQEYEVTRVSVEVKAASQ